MKKDYTYIAKKQWYRPKISPNSEQTKAIIGRVILNFGF